MTTYQFWAKTPQAKVPQFMQEKAISKLFLRRWAFKNKITITSDIWIKV